jgi:hypothetical protein
VNDNRLPSTGGPPPGNDRSLFVPVARQYQPEPAALEQLVGLLYELLTDTAITEYSAVTARPQPACFSVAPE